MGYSDSLDFVPVRLGYWNCLDEKPPASSEGLFQFTSELTNVDANTTVDEVAAREEEDEDEKVRP